MSAAPAQEQRPHVPESPEAYLRSFEKEWEGIHAGGPPEIGLRQAGRPERKAVCEDVTLHNREKGLFLVADGVSSSNGWFASRETARMMYGALGESLDRGIENNLQEALAHGEDPTARITKFVTARMIAAVEQAHSRIRAIGALSRDFQNSATTLSLVKWVELPDGRGGKVQRLFFTNIGDSRIYVLRRGGRLEQVTRDDSLLQQRVARGEVSPEDAQAVDQAYDSSQLHPRLRPYASNRNVITKSVGIGNPTEGLCVSSIDLQPGDRFAIVSDGISDQLLEGQIRQVWMRHTDDRQAQQALQSEALAVSLDGRSPRAKGDDISAVVQTVTERGPDRAYLRAAAQRSKSPEELKEALLAFRLRRGQAQQEIQRLEQNVAALNPSTPRRERLAALLELEAARAQEAAWAYHLEKTRLDLFDTQLPPRFAAGDRVQVWRDDFDPPGFDRHAWTVTGYDPQTKQYSLIGSGKAVREASRYELEAEQPGLQVRVGDEMAAVNEMGILERGFRLVAFDRDGSVILAKEADGVVKRVRVQAAEAQETFTGLMYPQEQARQRMVQASDAYHEALQRQQAWKGEQESIEAMERRQQAIDAAKQP